MRARNAVSGTIQSMIGNDNDDLGLECCLSLIFKLLDGLIRKPSRPAQQGAQSLQTVPGHGLAATRTFVWQSLDLSAGIDYPTGSAGRRDNVFAMLASPPRFVLDIGCASGDVARGLMEAYPEAKVWGIESNPNSAARAKQHLERVITENFDTVDWAAQRATVADFDTVLLLDVLEHMPDPWSTLANLRKQVNAQAQLVLSLPNVRNMMLIRDLMSGYWRYRDMGLLDVTHLRFFTGYEAVRMIYQTGFRVERSSFSMSIETSTEYMRMKDGPFPQRIEFEKGSLLIESLEELQSFAALQHLFLIRPAHYDDLDASEKVLAQGAHPPTHAMGADYAGIL